MRVDEDAFGDSAAVCRGGCQALFSDCRSWALGRGDLQRAPTELSTLAIPDVAPMSCSPSDGTMSTISSEWLVASNSVQHQAHEQIRTAQEVPYK